MSAIADELARYARDLRRERRSWRLGARSSSCPEIFVERARRPRKSLRRTLRQLRKLERRGDLPNRYWRRQLRRPR